MSRAEEMRELFARWRKSGQSLMGFGRQEGVSYAKLLYWRRKLESDAGPETLSEEGRSPEFAPVTVVSDSMSAASPEKFEVWLSNGVSIDVATGFDEAELRRLVGVLLSC